MRGARGGRGARIVRAGPASWGHGIEDGGGIYIYIYMWLGELRAMWPGCGSFMCYVAWVRELYVLCGLGAKCEKQLEGELCAMWPKSSGYAIVCGSFMCYVA